MAEWDGVLSDVKALEPPMRDVMDWPVHVLEREPVGALHELTSDGANGEDPSLSRLPAPILTLLTPHDAFSIEHEIGEYITFIKETSDGGVRDVGPEHRFIDHHLHYQASRLPRVSGVMTMPIVLRDGTLLASNGLDRERRLVMRCDPKLLEFIPERDECDDGAVLGAFKFLVEDWFCDVAADLPSKCVLYGFRVISSG
jgi:hypothetical protein